jgi:AraC-like DNA-binding protein
VTITFSSADLPAFLGHKKRFDLWRDIYMSQFGLFDFAISEKLPFSAALEIMPVGPVALGTMNGTIEKVARTAHEVANDSRDAYCLVVNQGSATMSGTLGRRDCALEGGSAVLMQSDEKGSLVREARGAGEDWLNVVIPGELLRATLNNADDLVGRGTAPNSEAVRLLTGYAAMLKRHGAIASTELAAHAAHALMDLVVLSLGAGGESAEQATARGLRGARLQAVLGQIQQRFADVSFATKDIAAALNISPRYINDLLQETGSGFSERVLELRLQRARAMLADPRCAAMRIGAVAYAAGFADISYFNRSFRRRFGLTPTAAR